MVPLSAAVAYHARTSPERTALIYEGERVGYGQLHDRLTRAAGALRARGIGPGDIVALLMKNSAAFIELALAASHLGAVLLPINYRLAAEEVDYIVRHAGAKLMLADDELLAVAGSAVPCLAVDAAAQRDSRRLAGDAGPVLQPHPCRPDDLYRLMYTSGTTDRPKGVTHRYGNYYWKSLDHLLVLGLTRDERLLVIGPLYHVGAFDLPGTAVLLAGGLLCIVREFEPAAVLATIERERLTAGWMAPVMLNRLLACPERGRHDLSSLRWAIGGGERTPEDRIRAFTTLFPQGRYIDGYGLTETCSGDTLMEAGMELAKIGSTGRATPHVQIEIRDDEGRPLPPRREGEICLRGPKVTQGYWRDPERTQASFFPEGWFRSGDVGYLDEDGFLFLTDRKKDMIISGAENIASSEVERVLFGLPQVMEAAAIGLPDERWGERVVAVVVTREGQTLTEAQMQAHCRAHLAAYKVPKQLILRDALPRNPSGKVLKRVLRDELRGEPRDERCGDGERGR
jgi:fatty-acyl-CoA synthase